MSVVSNNQEVEPINGVWDEIPTNHEYIPDMVTARSVNLVGQPDSPVYFTIDNQQFKHDGLCDYVRSGLAWFPCFFHHETNDLIVL
ncbi:MAG: hypothetical protein ACTSPB_08700 [Candidatus Thorarchaeota archaeon]